MERRGGEEQEKGTRGDLRLVFSSRKSKTSSSHFQEAEQKRRRELKERELSAIRKREDQEKKREERERKRHQEKSKEENSRRGVRVKVGTTQRVSFGFQLRASSLFNFGFLPRWKSC